MYSPHNYNDWLTDLYELCQSHCNEAEDKQRAQELYDQLKKGMYKLCRLATAISRRTCPSGEQWDCDDIHTEPDGTGV